MLTPAPPAARSCRAGALCEDPRGAAVDQLGKADLGHIWVVVGVVRLLKRGATTSRGTRQSLTTLTTQMWQRSALPSWLTAAPRGSSQRGPAVQLRSGVPDRAAAGPRASCVEELKQLRNAIGMQRVFGRYFLG